MGHSDVTPRRSLLRGFAVIPSDTAEDFKEKVCKRSSGDTV